MFDSPNPYPPTVGSSLGQLVKYLPATKGWSALAGKKKSGGKRDEPNPEFDNFQRLLKGTLSVPKKELDKRRADYERRKKQEG